MNIIDIGEAFYVLSEIAYMTKDANAEQPIIKMFLKGNPGAFTVGFNSVEERDKCYNEWKDMIVKFYKTKA